MTAYVRPATLLGLQRRAPAPPVNGAVARAADYLRQWCGVEVDPQRLPLLTTQLARIGHALRPDRGAAAVVSGDQAARERLVDFVTEQDTYLFRHIGHYAALRSLAVERAQAGVGIRVLCVGSSTGEEAWSAAAVLASTHGAGRRDFCVDGWELSGRRVGIAREATYHDGASACGLAGYERYFARVGDRVVPAESLRHHVRFEVRNVLDAEGDWPRYDAILFRNVSDRWQPQAVARAVAILTRRLVSDGLLLVGPADPIVLDVARWQLRAWDASPVYRRRLGAAQGVAAAVSARSTLRGVAGVPAGGEPGRHSAAARQPGERAWVGPVQRLLERGQALAALALLCDAADPDQIETQHWNGVALLALGAAEPAVAALRWCARREPAEALHREWLAAALAAAGRTDEAERVRKVG